MDYQRQRHPERVPHILRSDNLRRVNLDSVSVNWLVAMLEKLPEAERKKQNPALFEP